MDTLLISANFSPSDLFFWQEQVNDVWNGLAFLVVGIDALLWSESMRFCGGNRCDAPLSSQWTGYRIVLTRVIEFYFFAYMQRLDSPFLVFHQLLISLVICSLAVSTFHQLRLELQKWLLELNSVVVGNFAWSWLNNALWTTLCRKTAN